MSFPTRPYGGSNKFGPCARLYASDWMFGVMWHAVITGTAANQTPFRDRGRALLNKTLPEARPRGWTPSPPSACPPTRIIKIGSSAGCRSVSLAISAARFTELSACLRG